MREQGLSYKEIATRARELLPPGSRLSATSVWHYAKGKTYPRQVSYLKAIGQVVGMDLQPGRNERDDGHVQPSGPERGYIKVEDRPAGKARLIIDLELNWPVAIKILSFLNTGGDAANSGEQASESAGVGSGPSDPL